MGERWTLSRMMRWVAALVRVMPHWTWGLSMRSVSIENGSGGSSPGCISTAVQSMVRPSSRGGVPVLSRPSANPSRCKVSDRPSAGASPTRPAGVCRSPMWMSPRRKVPVVSTTAPAPNSRPSASLSPAIRSPRIRRSSASASTTARFGVVQIACCMAFAYSPRSACARGPRTAGPLRRLSTRNWMPPRSATRPIRPSSASISRTRWPLPRPPIAGLHDIAPMVAKRWVTSATLAPMRAAAAAASQPAWPPPTTMTSYRAFIVPNSPSAELLPDCGWSVHFQTVLRLRWGVSRETSHASHARYLRPLFADTKIPKDHVENILHIHPPEELAQCPARQAKLLRHDFLSALLRGALSALQREHGFFEMCALPLARHQGGFRCEEAPGKARERVKQFIDTNTGRAGHKVNSFLLIESGFNSSLHLLLRHQVHFVNHQPSMFVNHQPSMGFGWSLDEGALQCPRLDRSGIDDPQHEVCAGGLLARSPHAFAFDWIVRFANAGGIEHRHRIAAEIEMQSEDIARGARKRRHDRSLAACQPVEQRRLARIRRTRDGNAQAFAQTLALPRARLADLLGQRPNEFESARHHVLRDIVLVGKIDAGLDQSQRLDQPLPPCLGAVAEETPELLVCLSTLCLGLSRDQVGEPFDRGQIHAAVLERAARELPRFRMAQARELCQRGKHRRDHRAAAVHLQLGDVFAGLAVWPGKPQRQPFVDDVSGCRIAHARKRRAPRLRHASDQPFERNARARTRNANDRDRRRRSAGGESKDGIAVGGHSSYSDRT